MTPANSRERAFTLVEVLMVLAGICILLALLAPAVDRARAQANRARWVSLREGNKADPSCALYYTFNKVDMIVNAAGVKARNLALGQQDVWMSARTLDGEVHGGVFNKWWGRFGNEGCVTFAGMEEQWVEIPLSGRWYKEHDTGMTVEMWVRPAPTDTLGGEANVDVCVFGAGNTPSPRLEILIVNGTWHVSVDDYNNYDTGMAALYNRWQHITLVLDDYRAHFYRDGMLAINDGISYTPFGLPRKAFIGGSNWDRHTDNGWPFFGHVAEFAIHTRALTPDEIRKRAQNRP